MCARAPGSNVTLANEAPECARRNMYARTYSDVLKLARVDEVTDFTLSQAHTLSELLRRL